MLKKNVSKILILGLAAGLLAFGPFSVKAQGLPQIPEDVRKQVPEKDLIEIYCLMTKWKTGEFFAALDALNEVLLPALNDLKDIGIGDDVLDIAGYRSQAQEKLNSVCSAQSFQEVETALKELIAYGETVRSALSGLGGSLGVNLKAKGEQLKAKVESEMEAWAQEQKGQIEQELQGVADQLAQEMKTELEQEMAAQGFTSKEEADAYVQTRVAQIKSTIDAKLQTLVAEKKKALEAKANGKASEILGVDAEKFKALGKKMQGIEGEINKLIAQKKKDYEVYKIQAMEKRKQVILSVVNKNIEGAANKIQEKSDLLEEAKTNDSSVKSAAQYIAELESDKEILVNKIEAAVEGGDETAITSAVEEMKNKWDGIRQNLERDLAKRQSAKQICSQVTPQTSQAKFQIESAISQMETAQKEISEKKDECDIAEMPLCAEVGTIFNQLSSAKEKAKNLIDQINLAKETCVQVTEETPLGDILELMLSLRETGSEFQKEMLALKEEWQDNKTKLEKALAKKPKVKEICGQALPKLVSGKSQTENGLSEIKSIRDNCQGSAKAQCELVNANLGKFDSAQEKGKALLDKVNLVENKCQGKTTLKELVPLLKGLESDLEEFLSLVEELKSLKEAGTEKIYIQAEDETSTYLYPRDVSWASNKEIKARWRPGYTGTGDWYLSRGGESLSYNFTVQEGGSYSVWIKDISTYTHSAGARAVNVIVDGKDYGSFSENSVRRGDETGTWDWHKTATFDLKAGAHTLTIKKTDTTSAAAILDAYFITNNPLATP